MISLNVLLFVFIALFAIIGAMRGWAKELLVTFSIILAMFTMNVLENWVPFFQDTISTGTPQTVFWLRTAILSALVFAGYQTPRIPRLADSGRFVRNLLQDGLLGVFLGGVNGFLIFGTIWYYLDVAGYPFAFVTAPDTATAAGTAAARLLAILPPHWLMGTPTIYFAVAISFVFVIMVFI